MPSISTDRLIGVSGSLGVKAPVAVATTVNISLAGLQTIDGYTTVEFDRVLVKDQTSTIDNGIYLASTGAWTRASDFDATNDAVKGTFVIVANGSTYSESAFQVTSATVVIGTSAITFTETSLGTGVLLANNNLSDVASQSVARTNLGVPTDSVSIPKPMNPFSDGQSGSVVAKLDNSFTWNGSLFVFENLLNNPLYDGGITSFIVQSNSLSTIGQNIVGITGGPYAAGTTTINISSVLNFAVDKTVAVQQDDGSIHLARTTAVGGSSVTFTPATTFLTTADGSVRQLATSRATQISVNAASGATGINTISTCGETAGGAIIRIQLNDGTWHKTTLTSIVGGATPSSMFLTVGLPSAANAGNLVIVGTLDIDANLIRARKGFRAVNSDILCGDVWTGPSTGAQGAADVQYVQGFARIVESDGSTGYEGEYVFGTADGTSSGTTRETVILGNGIHATGLTNPTTVGAANFSGSTVNNGDMMTFQKAISITYDFVSIPAVDKLSVTATVTGALAGDECTVTIPPGAGGTMLDFKARISATSQVTLEAVNYTSGAIPIGSQTYRVVVRRFV